MVGVVFLGTPLRGTATARVAEWLALICEFVGKETSTTLLQRLKKNAGSLETLATNFQRWPMRAISKYDVFTKLV